METIRGCILISLISNVALAAPPDLPFEDIQAAPLAATWQFSSDGGKTFSGDPPPGASPAQEKGTFPLAIRGTFEVDDPSQIAALWVRIAEEGESPRASICNGDLVAASGSYWKDLGFCPTLLNARITLNGKPVKLTRGPMLYFWLPLEGEIHQGANTIELAGDCYTYWLGMPAKAITARLLAAEPQPAAIYNGPLLGDFGDGYFTLACRTQLPAELTVEATPTEPAGEPIQVTSSKSIWHRVKVEVPPETKLLTYRLTARVGAHQTSRGPYTMRFPGEEYRFVALGNVMAHQVAAVWWKASSQMALKLNPAFILHTGNCSEHGTWDFEWEQRYFEPAGKLLSSVPTFLTPSGRDFAGAVQELHYTPAPDTYMHSWSKVIGLVRLIGLDGNQDWTPGGQNHQWLEHELANAKEKYIFVLDAYPGYSSGKHSRKPYPWLMQTRNSILPLLAKYKATALVSGWDPDYERCEPPADRGCTQIVIGSSGKESYRFSGRAGRLNPFGQGKGRDWAGGDGGVRAICQFDVHEDRVDFQALQVNHDPAATDLHVLDKKVFRPR